jgi:hypothetical protein
MPKYFLQISARMLSWPQHCACCGGTSDAFFHASATKTTGKRVVNTRTSWWEIPYCSSCLLHVTKYKSAAQIIVAGIGIALIVGFVIFFMSFVAGGAIELVGTFLLLAFLVGVGIIVAAVVMSRNAKAEALKLLGPNCVSPDAAVAYTGWYGTAHNFVFASKSYADEFVALNHRKTMSGIRQIG